MKTKRGYVMRARAEAASATRQRILEGAVAELWCRRAADVRLDDIAGRAATTVQTVLRLFGSRAKLIDEAWDQMREHIVARRETSPPGDVDGMVRALYDHYEEMGDFVIRMLADEDQLPDMAGFLARGRKAHRQSMQKQLAPLLARVPLDERRAALDCAVAACDVYTWKLFRRDMRHGRDDAEALVLRLLRGILGG
jgi:AcrR family transcriptional regulator